MNIFIIGTIILVVIFLFLSWFITANTTKIAKAVRRLLIVLSLILGIILLIGGRILFSLPLFFIVMSALKIKGLTAFQIWNLWRVINYLRSTGRFSYFGQSNQHTSPNNLTLEEAYKILGLKKGCSKSEVVKACKTLQKKLHPDMNPDSNTERLSQIINEAKDLVLKNDFV